MKWRFFEQIFYFLSTSAYKKHAQTTRAKLLYPASCVFGKLVTLLPIIAAITVSSSVNLSCVFIRLKLWRSMGRYWNVRVLERRFSLINSSHRYSTQPNYRSTPNYPTKTKARVPLSLFVALRLFSRADTRSGVHITRFSFKSKNVRV